MIAKCYEVPRKHKDAKRILFLSDLHNLHQRVPTYYIVESELEMVRAYAPYIDALYITGDYWDDSKYTRNEHVHVATSGISTILGLAKHHGFSVRILNGTPSHDYGQSEMFISLNSGIGADVKYLNKIGIFYDESIKMHVGWVEDEYNVNAKDTEVEFSRLLREHGLDSVDLMVMHGCFKFQLPIESVSSHCERFWQKVVKYSIVIGHDHRFKFYGKITVPGSLERLSFNEEEDKGGLVIDFRGEDVKQYLHVNKRACLQLTVPLIESYEEQRKMAIEYIERILNHESRYVARLRIFCKEDSPIIEDVKKWKKEHDFHIQVEKERVKKRDVVTKAFDARKELENITPENIATLLSAEHQKRYEHHDKDLVLSVIKEHL